MKYKVVIDALKNFIQKRATHASKQKFKNALAKFPQAEPAHYDRLPASARKDRTRALKN